MKKNYASEHQVQNAVMDFLRLKGIAPIHHRTTGGIIKRGDKIFFAKAKADQRGVADILFSYRGLAVAYEIKSESGSLSDDQINWSLKWKAPPNNAYYYVVRSVLEAEKYLSEIDTFATRRNISK